MVRNRAFFVSLALSATASLAACEAIDPNASEEVSRARIEARANDITKAANDAVNAQIEEIEAASTDARPSSNSASEN